jgi:hypothetical protein
MDKQEAVITDDMKAAYKAALVLMAQALDDAEGYEAFYELVFDRKLPKHAREWIEGIYEARAAGKGIVIQAFRGSTKTTTLTIGFTAWRIGKEPERANLLVQVGDDIAVDNTAQIAGIIEYNDGFTKVFPYVKPDKELGWGASGYQVKRVDMEYGAWRQLNAKRKDPTLVGVGYKSREIIGKHPDGCLIVDDIHDESNTASERELGTVRRILTGTIFPTAVKETWRIAVGTPWVENDVYHYIAATGEFLEIKTPVIDGNGVYTWAKRFSEADATTQMNLAGSIEYARMFMLDLSKRKNRMFKYQLYPNIQIKADWPMVGGVDYAGTGDEYKNKSGVRDYFALAYVAKLPGGGAVVVDGVLDRCTQGESEAYVKKAQAIWPNWVHCAVEGDGMGQEFIQVLRRNPGLKIIPMRTQQRAKSERLMVEMAPWFENGMVRISDAESDFLNELRKEMDMYPLSTFDDALDAVYWALRLLPDVLKMPRADQALPDARHKPVSRNPFIGMNKRSGKYGTRTKSV